MTGESSAMLSSAAVSSLSSLCSFSTPLNLLDRRSCLECLLDSAAASDDDDPAEPLVATELKPPAILLPLAAAAEPSATLECCSFTDFERSLLPFPCKNLGSFDGACPFELAADDDGGFPDMLIPKIGVPRQSLARRSSSLSITTWMGSTCNMAYGNASTFLDGFLSGASVISERYMDDATRRVRSSSPATTISCLSSTCTLR